MKKFLLILLLPLLSISLSSQAQQIMRGEVSPGVYQNVAVSGAGVISTSSATSSFTTSSVTAVPTSGALVDRSGTLTTAATAQTIAPALATRRYLLIQNTSDTAMWCNFAVTAVVGSPSFMIAAGATFLQENSVVSNQLISCVSSVSAKTYTAKEF